MGEKRDNRVSEREREERDNRMSERERKRE